MGFFYSWLLCPCIYFGFLLLWETYWGISRTPWNSLKNPWNFKPINPCLDMQLPWNTYPNPCLEIQGFSRSTSFSPWNFSVTLNLENPWNFFDRSPWPWKNLEFQGQFQGTLKFKAMIVLPKGVLFSSHSSLSKKDQFAPLRCHSQLIEEFDQFLFHRMCEYQCSLTTISYFQRMLVSSW